MNLKKFLLAWISGMLVSLYTAFVVLNLWNWFIATTFNIPEASYWYIYGMLLLISLFTDNGQDFMQEQRWKIIFTTIDICLPEQAKEEVASRIKDIEDGIWSEVCIKLFGRIAGFTLTLIFGWVVHIFFTR